MKKTISSFLLALFGMTLGLAYAEPTSTVTESTDPEKVESVERRASVIRQERAGVVAGAHKEAQVDRSVRKSTVTKQKSAKVAGAHKEAEVDRTMRRSTARKKKSSAVAGAHQEAREARQQQQQPQQDMQK